MIINVNDHYDLLSAHYVLTQLGAQHSATFYSSNTLKRQLYYLQFINVETKK